MRTLSAAALTLAILVGAAHPGAAASGLNLHVPSPDWRDQIIYFALTDRFDDGQSANNDQGAGEFKPGSNAHYQGGDLAGLTRRVDYIRGLGATALWITPPVANLWWDPHARYGGYHGYWARHFAQVDEHLGTLADYRQLSHTLHEAGMYLVQDIVVNHTGNFFSHGPGWRADRPAASWHANEGTRPTARPSQPPFDRNDARDAGQRHERIYHWTPDVRDFTQRRQVLDFQMSGLDDLNTDNPVVRRALRQSYGHWIREVGVDAFRVDTAFYVPPSFFDDFLHARDAQAPGVLAVARQTGRQDFFVFGEGFAIDKPFQTRAATQVEAYATAPHGRPRLQGMLNFSLYGSLGDVLARGAPSAQLAHRIQAMVRQHRDVHHMPSFVDNHDVDRFLSGGSEAALRQALLAIMTLPGIPVIYYGTEQGFDKQRAAMFASGVDAGGRDHFNTQAPLYQLIRQMSDLRRSQRLFSRGWPTLLASNAVGPGLLAWRMQHGGLAALVVLNTADEPTLAANLATGAPPGSTLVGAFDLAGTPQPVTVDGQGRLNLLLAPRSGQVWLLPSPSDNSAHAAAAAQTTNRPLAPDPAPPPARPAPAGDKAPRILGLKPSADGDTALVYGQATPGARLLLVQDGRLAKATAVQADAQGRWSARLGTQDAVDAGQQHEVVAWQADARLASAATPYKLPRAWRLVLDQADPRGDDLGREDRTRYPTDPSWGARRQMDLERLRVWRSGGALRAEVTLRSISQSWNPANGFDHVALTLFFEAPAGHPADPGQRAMPLQDGDLPGDMRWHYRLRTHGWSNAWFSADGASAGHEGLAATPGARIEVNRARRTIQFTWPAAAFAAAPGIGMGQAGWRLYLNTWDWDGGYRTLLPEAGGHSMGGGPGPKVMDEMGPFRLR